MNDYYYFCIAKEKLGIREFWLLDEVTHLAMAAQGFGSRIL